MVSCRLHCGTRKCDDLGELAELVIVVSVGRGFGGMAGGSAKRGRAATAASSSPAKKAKKEPTKKAAPAKSKAEAKPAGGKVFLVEACKS